MTEREIDRMLCRAYLLGARGVACQYGQEIGAVESKELERYARAIAERDFTLEDPTALAAKEPDIADILHRIGPLIMRNDRNLATRIARGFQLDEDEDD